MRRSLAAVLALIASLMLAGTAVAAPVGTTTINLRTWEGTTPIDGVRVCLARGGDQVVCGETEDGELWADSLPAGAYRAWVEPTGYELVGITCTTFPMSHTARVDRVAWKSASSWARTSLPSTSTSCSPPTEPHQDGTTPARTATRAWTPGSKGSASRPSIPLRLRSVGPGRLGPLQERSF